MSPTYRGYPAQWAGSSGVEHDLNRMVRVRFPPAYHYEGIWRSIIETSAADAQGKTCRPTVLRISVRISKT